MMNRRQALALGLTAAKGHANTPVPPGVRAILTRILSHEPQSLNTDWFGTMPLIGLLRCRPKEAESFVKAWLTHHLTTKDVAKYTGNRSRVVWPGGLPLTTYAGHFGVSQVCEEIVAQFRDERALRIAQELAAIVLHRTARNRLGLIGHDDTSDFAIPDVTFFAVSSLMIGAMLDARNAASYREQAIYQLRTSIDTFLMKDTGLAKTLYRNGSVGTTYWTRASGWLLWSITALLRRSDDAVGDFKGDLTRLVDGMMRVQERDGGFHVLLDDPSTPLDSTGPAMFALGVHESVRRGWLPRSYMTSAEAAWSFVKSNLTDDGVPPEHILCVGGSGGESRHEAAG